MNAKHAKELRAIAQQVHRNVATTYVKHREGRTIYVNRMGQRVRFKLADSVKIDSNCTRGYYRMLKKLYRTPESVRFLYG